jgi:5-(carboxyamino)imidazole ribonucleotide synthase
MPDYVQVAEPADVDGLAARTAWPVVLKAVRGGYDGRGVWLLDGPDPVSSPSCSPRARR